MKGQENPKDVMVTHAPESFASMTHEMDAYTMFRIKSKDLFGTLMSMCHAKKRD